MPQLTSVRPMFYTADFEATLAFYVDVLGFDLEVRLNTDFFDALVDGSIRSAGAWGVTINTAAPLLMRYTDCTSAFPNSADRAFKSGSGAARCW